jgi:hypothetical protein
MPNRKPANMAIIDKPNSGRIPESFWHDLEGFIKGCINFGLLALFVLMLIMAAV